MARGLPAFPRGVEEGGKGSTAWWTQLGPQQWWGWEGQTEVKTVLDDCFWLGGKGDQGEFEGDQRKL